MNVFEALMRAAGDVAPNELAELLRPPAWHADAACRGMDIEAFFPERGAKTDEAKATCARCPVIDDCRRHALAQPEQFGIWGGMNSTERAERRKQLRADFEALDHQETNP